MLLPGDPSTDPSGVYFHRVKGFCTGVYSGQTDSWRNEREAYTIQAICIGLANIGVQPREVGIITAHEAQVELIRELIQCPAVQLGSVESFQGQERNVIIVSAVRSFDWNGVGFLEDRKRFSSILSRAKASLIIVGDDEFLCENSAAFVAFSRMPEVNWLSDYFIGPTFNSDCGLSA